MDRKYKIKFLLDDFRRESIRNKNFSQLEKQICSLRERLEFFTDEELGHLLQGCEIAKRHEYTKRD